VCSAWAAFVPKGPDGEGSRRSGGSAGRAVDSGSRSGRNCGSGVPDGVGSSTVFGAGNGAPRLGCACCALAASTMRATLTTKRTRKVIRPRLHASPQEFHACFAGSLGHIRDMIPSRRSEKTPILICESNFPLNYGANQWPVLAK
jgi:hypothetical protein